MSYTDFGSDRTPRVCAAPFDAARRGRSMPGAALSVSTFGRASVSASGPKRASSARAGPRASASATVGAGENADAMDAERLATWRRLLAEVPLAEVLPRDNTFGVDVPVEARNPDTTERLAFFGDKLLNAAVAEALYDTQMRTGGLNSPLGEMTKLVAAARSNALFARLLSRLLREDMVAAVPPDALAARTKHHSVGTMVEAAVFLVHLRGGPEGAVAVAEVGAFLLSQAEVGSPLACDVANHKGAMYEFMAKGASGSMRARGLGPQSPSNSSRQRRRWTAPRRSPRRGRNERRSSARARCVRGVDTGWEMGGYRGEPSPAAGGVRVTRRGVESGMNTRSSAVRRVATFHAPSQPRGGGVIP